MPYFDGGKSHNLQPFVCLGGHIFFTHLFESLKLRTLHVSMDNLGAPKVRWSPSLHKIELRDIVLSEGQAA